MQILVTLMEHYGLAFVFLNVLLVQAGVPLPAYPTLIVAGAMAVGIQDALLIVATATAASLVADGGWYLAGGRVGSRVLRVLCRLSLSPETCIRKTEDLYGRWGARSLLFAKFVPGFASIAAPLAGVAKTPVVTFLCMDGLGVALWAGFAVLIGVAFRGAVADVVTLLEHLGQAGLALVVAGLVLFVLSKWVQRRRFFHELKLARISVIELYGLIDDGERPIILDVRPRVEQARGGRIPGARTASLEDVADMLDDIGEHDEVIVYCDCPDEASAARLAKTLMQHGVVRVRPLFGGIEAWRAAGYAVEFD